MRRAALGRIEMKTVRRRAAARRFGRGHAGASPDGGSALERVGDSRWERLPGAAVDRFLLRDFDGKVVARLDTAERSWQERLSWRVPVMVGSRGADAFWLVRGETYRCARGLEWWDVEALTGEAARSRPLADRPLAEGSRRSVTGLVRQTVEHLAAHGPAATCDKVAGRLRPHLFLEEEHVWSELRLTSELAERPLPDGMVLVQGTVGDIPAASELPTPVSPVVAARLLEQGAELWLIRQGERVASACWIFLDAAPAIAAPRGVFRLPAGTAMLEDTTTSPDFRGQGLAPAMWLGIGADLRRRGYRRLLTKVEVDNAPSRRAVEKAGFVEGAILHLRRVAARNQVRIEPLGSSELARDVAERTR
jgi:ribosomal protein S18 acetylase RimI-like enzyme